MTYIIRPVEFKDSPPDIDKIKDILCESVEGGVTLQNEGFRDYYLLSLKGTSEDVLRFNIEGNSIIISGGAEAAVSIEVLYSCFIKLGGIELTDIKTTNLPVSKIEVENLNIKNKKAYNLAGLSIYLILMVVLALPVGLISLIIMLVW